MLKYLKFTSIPVENQDRALNFYVEKLGFGLKKDQSYGGDRWIEITLPNAESHFLLQEDPERVARLKGKPALALIADDIDETYRDLSSRGVNFTQEPTNQSWGNGTYALFTDSEGNTVMISDS